MCCLQCPLVVTSENFQFLFLFCSLLQYVFFKSPLQVRKRAAGHMTDQGQLEASFCRTIKASSFGLYRPFPLVPAWLMYPTLSRCREESLVKTGLFSRGVISLTIFKMQVGFIQILYKGIYWFFMSHIECSINKVGLNRIGYWVHKVSH